MDPELYVFPNLKTPALKAAASTALFAVVIALAQLLPRPSLWHMLDGQIDRWLAIVLGYVLFLYGSLGAWYAMREKNSVEDPKTMTATRILDTGSYARVRHPMYGKFILANAGLGLALNSYVGLGFALLSLAAFFFNGIFEERVWLIPNFSSVYRDYMQRVPARYFTPFETALLILALALNAALVLLR